MIPKEAGVYIFKDSQGKVLYVGKAINLYHRVASYRGKNLPLKTQILASQTASTETIAVESELEALILEANLIKKYLPPFNVRLTDDKEYLYIALTREDFPKVITARKKDLKTMKKFWGPFPSASTVRVTLKSVRRVFPWCATGPNKRRRACFYRHLNLCPGACTGEINKNEYAKIIRRFSKFLDGKKEELLISLTKEMKQAAKDLKFEEAGRIKKTIQGVTYLTAGNRTRLYLENPNFLETERILALEELKKDLMLPSVPLRIEGYDISNIQGRQATGSMVVLTNGDTDKSQYRRFKIRMAERPNDVGMMREVIKRRLGNNWPLPQLILIDGGRGQVRGAAQELAAGGKDIPVFGLAKRLEWLYPPQGEIIKLSKKSLSLKLLQKLRDEAHRFAVFYHRKLFGKSLTQ